MISALFWRLLSHTQKSFLFWNFLNKIRYSGPTFILFSGAYNHTNSSANLKLKKSYLREPQQALAVDHYSKVGSDVWTPIFECTPTQASELFMHTSEFKHGSSKIGSQYLKGYCRRVGTFIRYPFFLKLIFTKFNLFLFTKPKNHFLKNWNFLR